MLSQCETGSRENLRMVQLSPRPPVTSQPRSARSSQAVVDVFTPRNEPKTLWQAARGNRKWTSGMLDLADEDCFSILHTCCCPWLAAGYVSARLGESRASTALPCVWPLLRTKIRTHGGIQGTLLGDWCTSTCCPCCVLCQMSRELGHMLVQPEVFLAR